MNKIDGGDLAIMAAVFADEHKVGVTQLKPTFIVATGMWRLYDGNDYAFILCTDDFASDRVFALTLNRDCEIIEGEKLCVFTSVQEDATGPAYSLVLFKDKAWDGEEVPEE